MPTPNTIRRRMVTRMKASHPKLRQMEQKSHSAALNNYATEIYQYNKQLLIKKRLSPRHIFAQPEIDVNMRPILFDFLLEVSNRLKLQVSTFYLTISIIDRYCSSRMVTKQYLQLLGLCSLWIAAKFNETKSRVPSLDFLAATCCHEYSKKMFLTMELNILKTLHWEVAAPGNDAIIDLLLHKQYGLGGGVQTNVARTAANYLCQLMQFYHHVTFKWSVIQVSMASVLLSTVAVRMNYAKNGEKGEEADDELFGGERNKNSGADIKNDIGEKSGADIRNSIDRIFGNKLSPFMDFRQITARSATLREIEELIETILEILRTEKPFNSFKMKYFNNKNNLSINPIVNSLYIYANQWYQQQFRSQINSPFNSPSPQPYDCQVDIKTAAHTNCKNQLNTLKNNNNNNSHVTSDYAQGHVTSQFSNLSSSLSSFSSFSSSLSSSTSPFPYLHPHTPVSLCSTPTTCKRPLMSSQLSNMSSFSVSDNESLSLCSSGSSVFTKNEFDFELTPASAKSAYFGKTGRHLPSKITSSASMLSSSSSDISRSTSSTSSIWTPPCSNSSSPNPTNLALQNHQKSSSRILRAQSKYIKPNAIVSRDISIAPTAILPHDNRVSSHYNRVFSHGSALPINDTALALHNTALPIRDTALAESSISHRKRSLEI